MVKTFSKFSLSLKEGLEAEVYGREEGGQGEARDGRGVFEGLLLYDQCLEQVLMNFWLKMTATKEKFTWLTDQW